MNSNDMKALYVEINEDNMQAALDKALSLGYYEAKDGWNEGMKE